MIDKALQEVNAFRGEMGAFQANTLESYRNYLRIARGNVISSESVIHDADMAEEMMQFTRNQIMVDSSTAMLAQANQQPWTVLGLIGSASQFATARRCGSRKGGRIRFPPACPGPRLHQDRRRRGTPPAVTSVP